ncbi:MAG: ParA family protein [Lentisphaeria bacterium]|nr:ParA family protein [Candidatus Neomarinimicrobiota bacterium]MCF7842234.1 ParA family protein [Lentisphaeria bacterium]
MRKFDVGFGLFYLVFLLYNRVRLLDQPFETQKHAEFMLKYTIFNEKGGVGKTTISANLAAALALRKMKVLAIDFDPKGNLTNYFLAENPIKNKRLEDVFNPDLLEDNIVQVRTNLYLLPAFNGLYSFDKQTYLSRQFTPMEDYTFIVENLLQRLRFDFIIIDALPTFNLLTLNAIQFTKYLLVPVSMNFWAMQSMIELDTKIFNLTKVGRIYKIIPNFYDRVTTVSRDILHELRGTFLTAVTKSVIPRRIALEKASGASKTIFEAFPNDPAAAAFKKLAREIMIQ